MVYDAKTYVCLHKLTDKGKENYEAMLEAVADEILFRHEHPVRWMLEKIKKYFNIKTCKIQ